MPKFPKTEKMLLVSLHFPCSCCGTTTQNVQDSQGIRIRQHEVRKEGSCLTCLIFHGKVICLVDQDCLKQNLSHKIFMKH